jgi:hypothetical protein
MKIHNNFFTFSKLSFHEFNYIDGKKNGLYRSYYESGQLWRKYNYIDGRYIKKYEEYSESGELKELYYYNKYNYIIYKKIKYMIYYVYDLLCNLLKK